MDRPNVLVFFVDHWAGALRRSQGHPYILSPTVDQLAGNGVQFTRAYSATPTCIPARRELMTGTHARTHGDRVFNEHLEMDPNLPTMPQVFRDAGYQACAVGKLHVYPQRDRIGFDDVILCEEGRHHLGNAEDDFELFLKHEGYAGQELTHAMGTNEYTVRPWHLPEHTHPTNWTTREMCRTIQRRDPTRPAFWFCSYIAPHPPVTPPKDYLDMYSDRDVDEPFVGEWAEDPDALPYMLRAKCSRELAGTCSPDEIRDARRGFYAQCTYIDHQMRLIIGTLREEGLLDNTIILLTGDHGDMLGNHGQWGKTIMFEWSNRIPMILVPAADCGRAGCGVTDDRLAALCDVMPTLLGMCDIPVPGTVEGLSLVGEEKRDYVYGEHNEGATASRMIRKGHHKFIYYPAGNHMQLFDLDADPNELHNIVDDPGVAEVRADLEQLMVQNLYGSDLDFVADGTLVGMAEPEFSPVPNRGLSGQRGWR